TGPKAGGKHYLLAFGKPKTLLDIRISLKQDDSGEFKENFKKALAKSNIDLQNLLDKSKWGENELLSIPGQISELNYDIKIKQLNIHISENSCSLYTAILIEACQKFEVICHLQQH